MPLDDISWHPLRMHALALVRIARDRLRVVNVDDVYLLAADGGDTLVHRRGTKPLRDGRSLGQLLEAWGGHPFVRVHESFAVHPLHVYELRLRDTGRDWEVRLEPPKNTVIPVSRAYADGLWAAFEP
jgi:DNA-binding LytR/AlgR family response regulator